MKALFAISITTFLLVILYAYRSPLYDLYTVYQFTPGKAIGLFLVLDAFIVEILFVSLSKTARLAHWLLNGHQDIAEPEFNPVEEYLEA